jgi:hypothetical protein
MKSGHVLKAGTLIRLTTHMRTPDMRAGQYLLIFRDVAMERLPQSRSLAFHYKHVCIFEDEFEVVE